MYDYRDLSRLTTVAVWCVAAYLVLEVLFGAARFYDAMTLGPIPDELSGVSTLAVAIGVMLAFFTCVVVVGRWIYRASANAHAISDEMTISPG